MFRRIKELKLELDMWCDGILIRYGPERREFARTRLAAHEEAMKKGGKSPYTHPELFDLY